MANLSTISGNLGGANWGAASGFTVSGSSSEIATFDTSGASLLRAAAAGWTLDSFTFKMTFPTSTSVMSVELRDNDGTTNFIRLLRNSGSSAWQCIRRIASVDTTVGTISDAQLASEPWVKISISGGNIIWATSATYTGTYTTRQSVAVSTFPTTNIRPRFQISAAPTGNWVVSNINGLNAGTNVTVSGSLSDAAAAGLAGSVSTVKAPTISGAIGSSPAAGLAGTVTAVDSNDPFVRRLGSATNASAGTTLTITLTEAVPIGDMVFVTCGYDTSGTSATVADSRSNTYTRDRAAGSTGSITRLNAFSAPITTALQIGDTITITTPSVTNRVATADQFTLMATAPLLDQGTGISGNGTAVGNTLVANATAHEVVISVTIANGPTSDTFTEDPLYETIGRVGTSNLTSTVSYRYETTIVTQDYDSVLGTSRNWLEFLFAYKLAPLATDATVVGTIGTAPAAGLAGTVLAVRTAAVTGTLGDAPAAGLPGAVVASQAKTVAGEVGTAAAAGLAGVVVASQTKTIAGQLGDATAEGLAGSVSTVSTATVAGAVGAASAAGLAGVVVSNGGDRTVQGEIGDAAAAGLAGSVSTVQEPTIQGEVGDAAGAGLAGTVLAVQTATISGSVGSVSAAGLAGSVSTVSNPTIIGTPGVGSAAGRAGVVVIERSVTVVGSAGNTPAQGLPGVVVAARSVTVSGVGAVAEVTAQGLAGVVVAGVSVTIYGGPGNAAAVGLPGSMLNEAVVVGVVGVVHAAGLGGRIFTVAVDPTLPASITVTVFGRLGGTTLASRDVSVPVASREVRV